jgi:hypothetical protein
MTPSFLQVFFQDEAVYSALNQVKAATSRWINSSLHNEAVLLDEVSKALLDVASNKCRSQIYPDMDVSASRTILDRKGKNNQDLFGADLAVTLSLFEGELLLKQRTALFQLKVGARQGTTVKYTLDVRQIYLVGHNKHSNGRWFIAVCDNEGIWNLAAERVVAEELTELQLSKGQFPHADDRKQALQVADSWSSVAEWTLDWLSGAQGTDSDLGDSKRLEEVLSQLRKKEQETGKSRGPGDEFESQYKQYEILLPRIHIEYRAQSKRKKQE